MNPAWAPDARFRQRGKVGYIVQGATAFELNDVGVFIWKRCDGTRTEDDIAGELASSFGVGLETAQADCREYLDQLNALKLLAAR